MNPERVIRKKRDGQELSAAEIDYFIRGVVSGAVADYQIAAWAMAVYLQGMNDRETTDLALAMARSGDMIDLSGISGIKMDKHSTGGVGDKTTPVVVSLVAAAGIPVAKMSGRGLGFTGGTVDKFDAIPGFQTQLNGDVFLAQVNRIKAAVVSQSGNLAPADKKIYAIRDVTATIESIPLIASSIMSKKLASGADGIVLDVKVGGGAFMKDFAQAAMLAEKMVSIGTLAGRSVVAILTGMDQPLGSNVGNALEIEEAVQTLMGRGPEDLTELCLVLAGTMIGMAGMADDYKEGQRRAREILASGQGWLKFQEIVAAQGGDIGWLTRMREAHPVRFSLEAKAPVSGFITAMATEEIGRAAMMLGAGRDHKDDVIDYGAGLILHRKIGERIEAGQPIATLMTNDENSLNAAASRLISAVRIEETKGSIPPLLLGVVTEEGVKRYGK